MEIQIMDKQADMVQVRTPIGCFNGIWCSSTPIVSKRYIVELDSADVVTLSVIEPSDSCNPCIEYLDQVINVTGFVEEIQDNVMVLRLLKSLMMLEISSSSDFVKYIGHYVHIRLSEIRLYDTGIY
jgi:hypothetical protein